MTRRRWTRRRRRRKMEMRKMEMEMMEMKWKMITKMRMSEKKGEGKEEKK